MEQWERYYTRNYGLDYGHEEMNLVRPELIEKIHSEYIAAGADIIQTNTYGANAFKLAGAWTLICTSTLKWRQLPLVLNEYGLGHKAEEVCNRLTRWDSTVSDKRYSCRGDLLQKNGHVLLRVQSDQQRKHYRLQVVLPLMG
ncbi:hypothetical protein UACE39S_03738 [Ureibacillus acetophenoni]